MTDEEELGKRIYDRIIEELTPAQINDVMGEYRALETSQPAWKYERATYFLFKYCRHLKRKADLYKELLEREG